MFDVQIDTFWSNFDNEDVCSEVLVISW